VALVFFFVFPPIVTFVVVGDVKLALQVVGEALLIGGLQATAECDVSRFAANIA
jgi:hypothetical protein